MPVENMEDIVVKYLCKEALSVEESALLNQWLQQGSNQQVYDQLADTSFLEQHLAQFYLLDKKKPAARQRLVEEFFAGQKVIPIAYKKAGFKLWMAAAIMVPALAFGTWYFMVHTTPKKDVPKVATTQPVYDVEPGSDKATLTLADGSTVVLDNTNNGLVSQQGTTKIVKLASGELVYEPSGPASPVQYNTLSVPRNSKHSLQLPDGSMVWLNAASSLKYYTSFNGGERHVEITGEGYFEIKPIYKKSGGKVPFNVKIVTPAGDEKGEVEVLGTHFNVKAYTEEPVIQTTLLEGAVRITQNAEHAILKPGEQARIGEIREPIRVIRDIDVEQATAWRNGMIWFEKADVQTILREISRSYDVDVQYSGKVNAPEIRFVVPKTIALSKVLAALEEAVGKASPLHFTIAAGNKVMVTDK